MSRLKDTLSQTWHTIQTSLFPWLSEELGELTAKQQELVTTLEMIRKVAGQAINYISTQQMGGIPIRNVY